MALAPLIPNIKAHWALDEASGARADPFGSHTAADTTTVGSNTGKFEALAADFDDSVPDRLVVPHHADLGMPAGGQMTIGGWVNIKDTSVSMNVFAKWALSGTGIIYSVQFESTANNMRILVGNVDGDDTGLIATCTTALSQDTWYFCIFEIDEGADTVTADVNNANKATQSGLSWTLPDDTNDLWIGSDEATGNDADALMQGWFIMDTVITTGQKNEIYNSGVGYNLNNLLEATPGVAHQLFGGF